MASPVIVEWIVKGIPDVVRASRTVQDTVLAAERNATRAAQKEAAQRIKETENEAKRRNAIRERSATMAGQYAAKAAAQERREAEKLARDTTRTAEKAEREKTRFVEQAERQRNAIRERSATMAGQFAAKEVAREKREQATRQDLATRRHFATTVMGAGAAGMRNVARGLGRGASYLGSTISQLGGGFSVADAVNERSQLERQAILLSNKMAATGGVRPDKNQLMSKVKGAAIATGTDQADIMKAWNAYGDASGDFAGGEKLLPFFGKLAKATGSDLGQIAKTSGMLKVQNKNLGDKEMEQLLLSTVAAGRSGSVDMPELAGHAKEITKTSSSYAGSQAENQQKLLGLSQIGMRTGSISETATMLSNMSADAGKHHDKITKALGAGTFNEKGQIVGGPDKFIADMLAATGANPQKIQALGMGLRSQKIFQALAPTYNDAESKALAGGASKKDATAAAKAAVMADMKQFTGATMTKESLDKDFAEVMKSSAELFEGAVRNFKSELGEKLLPELVKLIPILQQLVPPLSRFMDAMIKVANWAEQNPLSGLAAAITLAIGNEMAKAAIGETIKKILMGGGGGGGGIPLPGGGGGGGMPGGLQGAGILGAMLAQGAGLASIYTETSGAMSGGEARGADLAARARAGDKSAMAEIAKAREAGSGINAGAGWVDKATRAASLITNPLGAAAAYGTDAVVNAAGTKSQRDNSTGAIEASSAVSSFDKSVAPLVAALDRNTKAVGSVAAPTAPGAPNRSEPIKGRN